MKRKLNKLPPHADTIFQRWYRKLTYAEKLKFAKRAGVSLPAIQTNFIRPVKRAERDHYRLKKVTRRQPKSETMIKLAKATRGEVTYKQIRDHFYPL